LDGLKIAFMAIVFIGEKHKYIGIKLFIEKKLLLTVLPQITNVPGSRDGDALRGL